MVTRKTWRHEDRARDLARWLISEHAALSAGGAFGKQEVHGDDKFALQHRGPQELHRGISKEFLTDMIRNFFRGVRGQFLNEFPRSSLEGTHLNKSIDVLKP